MAHTVQATDLETVTVGRPAGRGTVTITVSSEAAYYGCSFGAGETSRRHCLDGGQKIAINPPIIDDGDGSPACAAGVVGVLAAVASALVIAA